MKLDALEHPKTLDFAARLGVSRPTTLGHLELLWAFTGKHSPQGDIGKWPDGAIARACEWMGDPKSFLQSLLQSGFIDRHPGHRYVIHDWHEHAPRWVRAKLAKAKLEFVSSVVATVVRSIDDTSDDDGDGPGNDVATVEPTVVAPAGPSSKCSEVKGSEEKSLSQSARESDENVSRGSPPGETNGKGGEGNGRTLTPEAAMSIPLRNAGVKVTSIHPTLVAWVQDGYTVEQLLGAVAIAREALGEGAEISAKYLDKVLRDKRNWPQMDRPKPNGSNGQAAPTRRSGGAMTHADVMAALDAATDPDSEEFV